MNGISLGKKIWAWTSCANLARLQDEEVLLC